jgi:hypothetical protein
VTPELVGRRSHSFAAVRQIRIVFKPNPDGESNGRANASERRSLPSLPRWPSRRPSAPAAITQWEGSAFWGRPAPAFCPPSLRRTLHRSRRSRFAAISPACWCFAPPPGVCVPRRVRAHSSPFLLVERRRLEQDALGNADPHVVRKGADLDRLEILPCETQRLGALAHAGRPAVADRPAITYEPVDEQLAAVRAGPSR